jgi:hypothetical protein
MPQKLSKDIDAGSAVPVETATIVDLAIDDMGEASFPASDPPSSWTWDVAGRPPESAAR